MPPAQQEMCDKTERCMLGLCTKFTSPKRLAEYGCTCSSCSSSCVSWYVSSALRMLLATGLLMLLLPKKKTKKSAAISSSNYW